MQGNELFQKVSKEFVLQHLSEEQVGYSSSVIRQTSGEWEVKRVGER